MIFGKTYSSSKKDQSVFHLWFSWYPVRLLDGRWCWWEAIYRRMYWNEYQRRRVEYKLSLEST